MVADRSRDELHNRRRCARRRRPSTREPTAQSKLLFSPRPAHVPGRRRSFQDMREPARHLFPPVISAPWRPSFRELTQVIDEFGARVVPVKRLDPAHAGCDSGFARKRNDAGLSPVRRTLRPPRIALRTTPCCCRRLLPWATHAHLVAIFSRRRARAAPAPEAMALIDRHQPGDNRRILQRGVVGNIPSTRVDPPRGSLAWDARKSNRSRSGADQRALLAPRDRPGLSRSASCRRWVCGMILAYGRSARIDRPRAQAPAFLASFPFFFPPRPECTNRSVCLLFFACRWNAHLHALADHRNRYRQTWTARLGIERGLVEND